MAFSDGKSEYVEQLIDQRRVVKVTTGGRVSSYSVLMIVSNSKNNEIGWDTATASEASIAKKKAARKGLKYILKVNTRGGRTLPHPIQIKYGSSVILLKPAAPGRGIVAGGALRTMLEAIGLQDVVAKIIKSGNKNATVRCVMKAFSSLRSLTMVANSRSRNIRDILPHKTEKGNRHKSNESNIDNISDN